jgi:thiosulfate reductase cytochrome b subunit
MAAYLALALIAPPFKSAASPSFMALTISISFFVFEAMKGFRNDYLEYLGKRPIRFWLIMYVLFLIPLAVYAITTGTEMPFSFVPAWAGILAGILCIPVFYFISRAMDRFKWLDI